MVAQPTSVPSSALRVITLGDQRLKMRSVEVAVTEFGEGLVAYGRALMDVMRRENGVGLAAVQVGDLRRMLVVDLEGGMFLVNPRIVDTSKMRMSFTEGCLSVPGYKKTTNRPRKVTMEWQDALTGETQTRTFMGFDAIVIQHEMDHLEGKLIK